MSPRLSLDETTLARFCERHHIHRLSLFGSQLKGTARPDSDIDLLVEFNDDASVFDAGGLLEDLEELLSPYRVALVSAGGLLPRYAHIRAEARPI